MSLKIADDEFERGTVRMKDIYDEMLDICSCYSKIITKLMEDGICDVSIHNVMVEKLKMVDKNAAIMAEVVNSILKETKDFMQEIDKADSYLYD